MINKNILNRIDALSAEVKTTETPVNVFIRRLSEDLWEVTETLRRYGNKEAYGSNAVRHNSFTIKQPSDYEKYRPSYNGTIIIYGAPRGSPWNVDESPKESETV